jgi:hypothetical protein
VNNCLSYLVSDSVRLGSASVTLFSNFLSLRSTHGLTYDRIYVCVHTVWRKVRLRAKRGPKKTYTKRERAPLRLNLEMYLNLSDMFETAQIGCSSLYPLYSV